jgi:hypothetical protein
MRNTRAWKHTTKNRKQWGTALTNKRETPFMTDIDADVWASEMQYDNTDDGINEEE